MPETFFQELKRYVRFGPQDEAALRTFAPFAEGEFSRIVERFYERIAEHDAAAALLNSEERRARLKRTLHEWLATLFSGPWDEDYHALRSRIGRVHVAIELPQRYMFGAMSVIRGELSEAVKRSALSSAEKTAVERAIHKLLDLELAIMLESYRESFVERVQHLERLETQALERRLASARTVAAGLAHGVRNPLNSALLQLNVARRRLSKHEANTAEVEASVEKATSELERLSALVNDFLQFARPQEPRVAESDLTTVVEATLSMLEQEARRTGVSLSLDAPGSVYAGADDEQVQQVVLNLVRNAMDAAGAGGHVRVSVESRGDKAIITVEDDGPGFAPQAPIFEPFYTTKHEGTGLGLSVVHRVVSDHGGTVVANSRPGRTVFVVELPASAGAKERAGLVH